MYLYALTLQQATAITHCIFGNFSAPQAQEIIVAKGKILELLRPDENGKMQSILSMEVFGVIRSLMPFRLTGGNRDYVVVGSDSGRIVIIEYNEEKNQFIKVHQETFGKSGCRRIVPGQLLGVDPKGRAVMIAAVEKQKLVYVLNRDAQTRLTISSPLEAHKSHTLTWAITGVDVGYDNPIFAALEVDYGDFDDPETAQTLDESNIQKNLTFYELDLGLNNVVKKWSDTIDRSAYLLLSVPGGADGPGGVLVCCHNTVVWRNHGQPEISAQIPRRRDMPEDKSLMIVTATLCGRKDQFFFLLQSEYGDLYKATLVFEQDVVHEVKVVYYDTVPVSNSLCVLKTGFLFLAAEFGNHMLYQFVSSDNKSTDMETDGAPTTFTPRPLQNLLLIDEMESLSPIVDCKIADITREETAQIYLACGRGRNSKLKVLRHGLPVTEAANSPLRAVPTGVWSVKANTADEYDKYIILSFSNGTLVLSVSADGVEEVSDSGFMGNTTTLCVSLIGEDSLLQIHPNGLRHIRHDRRIHQWVTPGKKTIVYATANSHQVVIALSGGELFYFELDSTGQLIETEKKDLGREVACLDIAPVPPGRTRSRFLAVGDWDNTVRVLSLEQGNYFGVLSVQALPTQAESLCMVEITGPGDTSGTMFLNIGLKNGVLLRTVVDQVTGELTDTRTRFLGSRPVKLFRTKVRGSNAVLALSSRAWIYYIYQSRFQLTPLSYSTLDSASNFTSEQCPESIVAIAGNSLRILTLERLGEMFNQTSVDLRYTPRKMVVHPHTNYLIIIESDHNMFSAAQRIEHAKQYGVGEVDAQQASELDINDLKQLVEKNDRAYGPPKAGSGKWASCIRIFDVVENKTHDLIELEENEAAFSVCTCVFHDREGEVFVVVGTGKTVQLNPRTCESGFINVYRLVDAGRKFELLHKTAVDDVPTALCPFQGRLLAGVGNVLRIYDLGKKKVLRKCENKQFPSRIMSIQAQGDRIYVGDVSESVHFVKYKKQENQLVIFADETNPRWTTACCPLDYDTMAGADKFGNIFVSRLPSEISDDVDDDPTGDRLKWNSAVLNGAPHKLDTHTNYHIGEVCNTVAKAKLSPTGIEPLIYTTVMGGIGAVFGFVNREDVDFFTHLEMHLRTDSPPLCGRDHLSFRSYYWPVKDVIDGDLCEQYTTLEPSKQRRIAQELDRSPSEVLKKLEDMRNRLI